MPATESPFMHEIMIMTRRVPTASPPLRPPNHTWNIWYMSFAIPDSESMKPMKTNIGSVSIGYQLKSLMAALKPYPSEPRSMKTSAKATPTKPITPKTRCPVSISAIRLANIRKIIIPGLAWRYSIRLIASSIAHL